MDTPNDQPSDIEKTDVVEDELTQKSGDSDIVDDQSTDSTEDTTSVEQTITSDEPDADPEIDVTEVVASEESLSVTNLKTKLSELKVLLERQGGDSKDFRDAAKKSSEIVKYVIRNSKKEVLDALLDFFIENKDGVAKGTNIMKGSDTLPGNEERLVGVVFNLFYSLASKRFASVNSGAITAIVGKPELMNYYNKRKAGIQSGQ